MELKNHERNEFRRICSAEETVERVKAGLGRFGFMPNISEISMGNMLLHGYTIEKNGKRKAGGKGSTKELALASGLSEYAERYQFSLAYTDAKAKQEVDISQLVDKEYRKALYKLYSFGMFGLQCDAFSLSRKDYFRVPIEILSLTSGTNGLAAGNTIEEAIIQGSCEVFERHAIAKAINDTIVLPTLDRKLIKSPRVHEIIEILEANGTKSIIKDLSFGILPTVGVLFYNTFIEGDPNPFKKERVFTLVGGSSFSFEDAITRCFNEYVQEQNIEELKARRRCDIYLTHFQKEFPGIKHQSPKMKFFYARSNLSIKDMSYLLEGDVVSTIPEPFYDGSVMEDIESIKCIAERLGSEAYILDLTNPKINFPTVRVLMPHISDFRYFDIFEQLQYMSEIFYDNPFYTNLNSLNYKTAESHVKSFTITKEEHDNIMAMSMVSVRRFIYTNIFRFELKPDNSIEGRIRLFYFNYIT